MSAVLLVCAPPGLPLSSLAQLGLGCGAVRRGDAFGCLGGDYATGLSADALAVVLVFSHAALAVEATRTVRARAAQQGLRAVETRVAAGVWVLVLGELGSRAREALCFVPERLLASLQRGSGQQPRRLRTGRLLGDARSTCCWPSRAVASCHRSWPSMPIRVTRRCV